MSRFEGPLQADLYGEVAVSLGVQSQRLHTALDALREHDAAKGEAARRIELVEIAAERLWGFVVQRELLGLTDAEYIRREYRVPSEVWFRMGPRPRR